MLLSIRGLVAGLSLVFVASLASAAPITMSPDPVQLSSIDGTPNAFTLYLRGGSTIDNRLNFELVGPGGGASVPTVGAAIVVFDDVTITASGVSNVTDMLFFGPVSPVFGNNTAAGWLALDWLSAGSAEFYVVADRMFTTATVYSLSVGFDQIASRADLISNLVDYEQVEFSSAIPEPNAALIFSLGMLITGSRVSRRPRSC